MRTPKHQTRAAATDGAQYLAMRSTDVTYCGHAAAVENVVVEGKGVWCGGVFRLWTDGRRRRRRRHGVGWNLGHLPPRHDNAQNGTTLHAGWRGTQLSRIRRIADAGGNTRYERVCVRCARPARVADSHAGAACCHAAENNRRQCTAPDALAASGWKKGRGPCGCTRRQLALYAGDRHALSCAARSYRHAHHRGAAGERRRIAVRAHGAGVLCVPLPQFATTIAAFPATPSVSIESIRRRPPFPQAVIVSLCPQNRPRSNAGGARHEVCTRRLCWAWPVWCVRRAAGATEVGTVLCVCVVGSAAAATLPTFATTTTAAAVATPVSPVSRGARHAHSIDAVGEAWVVVRGVG